jgi:hypothetical protein
MYNLADLEQRLWKTYCFYVGIGNPKQKEGTSEKSKRQHLCTYITELTAS